MALEEPVTPRPPVGQSEPRSRPKAAESGLGTRPCSPLARAPHLRGAGHLRGLLAQPCTVGASRLPPESSEPRFRLGILNAPQPTTKRKQSAPTPVWHFFLFV